MAQAGLPIISLVSLILVSIPTISIAHDPSPAGQSLLRLETEDLPQGRVRINAIERRHPPGARTPWHTSGPKFIHLLEGTLTAHGLGGEVLLKCGPAPAVCFHSPRDRLWYFRNHGAVPVRFVLIAVDPVARPTIHEDVGQVIEISGNRVVLALGNLRTSALADPRRQIAIELREEPGVAVGDDVVTVRHDEKTGTAQRLVKLKERWQ